jgi:hypothetical protein
LDPDKAKVIEVGSIAIPETAQATRMRRFECGRQQRTERYRIMRIISNCLPYAPPPPPQQQLAALADP